MTTDHEPPFDGIACPACPTEVRGLFASAHNAINAWNAGDNSRLARKMSDLSNAVEKMQPLMEAHFANTLHSHGIVRKSVAPEEGKTSGPEITSEPPMTDAQLIEWYESNAALIERYVGERITQRRRPMPMQFRKRPVVIEAMQLTDADWDDVAEWCGGRNCFARDVDGGGDSWLEIDPPEGTMTAGAGDWIIKGVRGEFYPCKPDIFAATYEPAPDISAEETTCPALHPDTVRLDWLDMERWTERDSHGNPEYNHWAVLGQVDNVRKAIDCLRASSFPEPRAGE